MASAILTLIDPKRYGVIDIRVWQLLHELGSVTRNPRGVGFQFRDWYHYLKKLRHYANEFGVTARIIEVTLFRVHKKLQQGRLYDWTRSSRRR
jgi:hypothetical protein